MMIVLLIGRVRVLDTMRTKDLDFSEFSMLLAFTCSENVLMEGRPEYLTHIASATTGGVVAAIVTNPIWVVKTRLMVSLYLRPISNDLRLNPSPHHSIIVTLSIA